jgi:GntR family transcriptional repressor for pyruvate dehydrogenase complex
LPESSRQVRYRAAKRGRLHEEVVSQIQGLIEEHQLRPGDKLPPERELTKGFDVSRTVVREAVRSLEERGLVEVRHGSGVYVCQPSIDSVTESLALHLRVSESSLIPLLEVREILEVEIAGLAAQRATEDDRRQMEKSLRREAELLDSHDEYVEADLEFHELLTRATHNEVLPILINPLAELLRGSRRVTIEPAGSAQLSSEGHRSIYDAVKDGDKEGAREAMRQHLRMVKDAVRRAAARTAVDAC